MKRPVWASALAAVGVVGATLTVGSASEATPPSSTAGAASGECTAGQQGGEVTFGVLIETRGLDPTVGAAIAGYGGNERAAVYDVLVTYDVESGEYLPRMAESLEPNDDLTEWTLTLRDGIAFASGNPLTTAAVEFAVNRHGAEESASLWKPQVQEIDSIEIVDDLTMVFHLKNPFGDFPALLAGSPGMVYDPAVFDELGAEAFAANPGLAGAGPFVVERYVPGEELVVVRNENYWDGPVCLDSVRFVPVAAEDTRLDSFRIGEFDAVVLQDPVGLAEFREQGFPINTDIISGKDIILINHGAHGVQWPTQDVRVRQAIAHAIDPVLLDERLTGGMGTPDSAILSPRSALYTPELEGPAYDPDLAQQLLDEAKADGYDGTLTLSCHNAPLLVDWAVAVEGLLEAVGFDVELDNNKTLADNLTNYYSGNYEIMCNSLSLEDTGPWGWLQRTVGDGRLPTTRNGYVSEAMDAAMAELRAASTVGDKAAAMMGVQAVWNEEIPAVVTTHGEYSTIWHPDVLDGVELTSSGNVLLDDARAVGEETSS